MEELRREPRLRSLLAGTITFNNRQSSLSCTVRNVSPNGAMIVFAGIANAPEKFDLSIPRHNETRQATVMWPSTMPQGLHLLPAKRSSRQSRRRRTKCGCREAAARRSERSSSATSENAGAPRCRAASNPPSHSCSIRRS